MKIASYNLHFGGKADGPNLWDRLVTDFDPDIVCAQESKDPATCEMTAPFVGRVWREVPGRDWGSAIASARHVLEEIKLSRFEGSVVGAKLRDVRIGGVQGDLAVFSIHALTDKSSNYVKLVNQILDEIEALKVGTNLILAGDFNVTTAFRTNEKNYSNSKQELALLERLHRSFGLTNAWQARHPGEPLAQTLRWNNSPNTPYHCDAIFVHEGHLPHLASAEIVSTGIWGSASDHNPIVVELREGLGHSPSMNDVVVKVGGEGGSVVLYGLQSNGEWKFSLDFIEAGAPEGEGVVGSWEEAVALLDRYPWHMLVPVRIHPEFRDRVLEAVATRLSSMSPNDRGRIGRWRDAQVNSTSVAESVHSSDSWLYDE